MGGAPRFVPIPQMQTVSVFGFTCDPSSVSSNWAVQDGEEPIETLSSRWPYHLSSLHEPMVSNVETIPTHLQDAGDYLSNTLFSLCFY